MESGMEQTNPAPQVETPQAVVATETQGSPTATQTTPQTTQPSYDAKQVDGWKSQAEKFDVVTRFLDENKDLLTAFNDRYEGKTKLENPIAQPATQMPVPKESPDTPELQEIRQKVALLDKERRMENTKREVDSTLKKFPFLDYDKLSKAYDAGILSEYHKAVSEGRSPFEAEKMARAKMDLLPLEAVVYSNFQTELQDYLVKSKTSSGAYPPGVGSRGDTVRTGQSAVAQDFFDGKVNAYRKAGGSSQQMSVVQATMRDMQIDENDIALVRKVEKALRMGDRKLLN
jgi:hypothetical protein